MTNSGKDKNFIISTIVTAIKSLGFTEVYEGPLCRQCQTPSAFEFCSEACALDFWKTCREHYQNSSGNQANSFQHRHFCFTGYIIFFFQVVGSVGTLGAVNHAM